MRWTTLTFGKHDGKTLPQVALCDPDYIYWALTRDVFYGPLALQLEDVAMKAQRIRIWGETGPMRIWYYTDGQTGRLQQVEVISAETAARCQPRKVIESRCLDLLFASKQRAYDKGGSRCLVNAVRRHVFGGKRARITKERAERFFERRSNFIL